MILKSETQAGDNMLYYLSKVVEQSTEGIAVSDLEGKLRFVNPALAEMHGYTPDELIGRHLSIFHNDEQLEKVEVANQMLQKSGGFEGEIWHTRRSGEMFPTRMQNNLLRDEQGRPIGMIATVRDISSQKRAELTVRESERFLFNVFSSIQDGISVLDNELTIMRVNPTMERWYPHTLPLAGKKCHQAYHGRADPCEPCPVFRCMQTGAGQWETVPRRKPDGTISGWFEVHAYPLTDLKSGQVIGAIEYVRDITERKKLEQQLLVSQKMESVGRLAGGIAHDFNNLLGIIAGFADITLHDLDRSDPMYRDIEEIGRAAQQAAGLTRQLLAFSRRHILKTRVFDLNGVILDMHGMLRRLIGEDLDLFINLAPQPAPIVSDPVLIQQVIMNLVVNARDAMPDGGKLVIETSMENSGADNKVVLSISDTGCGMDAETLSKVYEPFFTTKECGKGTGLGLSTVYGIVKQSNGNIEVESRPGQGSVFRLLFPRASGRISDLPAAGIQVSGGTETVLVVEDEQMLLSLVARMLRRRGYQVLTARNGGEALLACESHSPPVDLLLTDVVMPQMSGRELAARLRREHPGMRVLYMSGYTDDTIFRHGVLEQGIPFIQKPFSADELCQEVRTVLDNPETSGHQPP